jgi:hypothetical protein
VNVRFLLVTKANFDKSASVMSPYSLYYKATELANLEFLGARQLASRFGLNLSSTY